MSGARVCRMTRTGGPEVLEWVDAEVPSPGPGEVTLRQTAVGLNYIDTYFRTGAYPQPLPGGIGMEAAGVVEAVGAGVDWLKPGDRAGYFSATTGAYATRRTLSAATVAKLPDGIDDRTAAAIMLKGCTAEFLAERCAKVQAGQTVLVHAAAGGVGLILTQWLTHIGARVIGTAGSAEKAALARAHGAGDVILYREEDIAARVAELTSGAKCDVVIDGIGKDTFAASLDCLRPRGLMISYGNASGAVGAVDFAILARKGSLFTTRPTLFSYYATRAEVDAGTARLFEMVASGAVKVRVDQSYALEDAATAHRDLEARATTGSTVLLP